MVQTIKNLLALWGTQAQFLGQEDSLEKGIATHSSILVWRNPYAEESGRVTVHGVTKSMTGLSN